LLFYNYKFLFCYYKFSGLQFPYLLGVLRGREFSSFIVFLLFLNEGVFIFRQRQIADISQKCLSLHNGTRLQSFYSGQMQCSICPFFNGSKYTTCILQKSKKSESRLVGEGIAKRRRSNDAITCHLYTFLL